MESNTTSLLRAARIVVASSWVALALGILGSATSEHRPASSITAAITSAIFVAVITYFPKRRLMSSGLPLELTIVSGAVLTVASATLTGTLNSPYLLMALLPTLLAAMASGQRMGLTTSFLSAGLLSAVVTATGGPQAMTQGLGAIALFPLLAVVVAQIRSLLVDVEERATHLEQASLEAEAELARLGHANELLHRLTDVYAEGSANPVDVGRSATEAIVEYQPGSFVTATLFDAQGPVVIARAGTDAPDHIRHQIPLKDGDTTSGVVSIGTATHLSEDDRSVIERLLRPVAVSFSNAVLLQEIAGEAVREERLRLARELHDEVGPALAALGFSLDSAAIQAEDADAREELQNIRQALGGVVDDLRGIIADLRSAESGGLASALSAAFSRLEGPPEIRLDVHEDRPPRSTAGRQILAVITEAVRNAHRHADAKSVTVSGVVDRERVELEVVDDGTGFDPARVPDGHFGLMGMRERADRIGATVNVESDGSGTTVKVSWKERR